MDFPSSSIIFHHLPWIFHHLPSSSIIFHHLPSFSHGFSIIFHHFPIIFHGFLSIDVGEDARPTDDDDDDVNCNQQ
jgi:hypothetical protein